MSERFITQITKKELDKGVVDVNHVLLELTHSSEGAKTQSGIIIGFLTDDQFAGEDGHVDGHAADLAEVYGKVYKLPQRLYFNPEDESGMPWECDMDLQIGDLVWFNVIESKNAVALECEGKFYLFIPYQDCYVARRHHPAVPLNTDFAYIYEGGIDPWDEVIGINGYVLLEPVHKKTLSPLDVISKDQIDPTKGIVRYFGKPNKRYLRPEYTDIVDLKEGDLVQFDRKCRPFLLERKNYVARFEGDKLFWIVLRRNIAVILKRE